MNIITRDLKHVWHPTSQMKDYETFLPLPVKRAKGAYLELDDGRQLLDAISSWWCKSLGHAHPRLQQAAKRQIDKFEHVILANTTNESIVALSEKLATLTPHLDRVFYAGDGACAIEIAVKMALRAQQLSQRAGRTKFMALKQGYHGETILTSALSDMPLFSAPYKSLMPSVTFIDTIPYVSSCKDALWNDCGQYWQSIEKQLAAQADTLAGIVLEPIVQGAGGMNIYSQDFLKRLRRWCTQNNVYLIADEIMTGLGRTGRPLACEHANIEPDFLCLAKNLTAGWLPMSTVLTSTATYNLFYDTYESGKGFLHSHTHSGNALAAAIAVESFAIMEEEGIYQRVQETESELAALMYDVQEKTGRLKNSRHIGAIVAADLKTDDRPPGRWGYFVYQEAVKRGLLLRPIGNTIYWLPPLNVEKKALYSLRDITIEAITQVLHN